MDCFLDIETTMDHKTIRLAGLKYCGVYSGIHGGAYQFLTTPTLLEDQLDQLGEGDRIFTYNGEGFDIPVLLKVWGIDLIRIAEDAGVELIDLYIYSKLMDNDRPSHSLDSWGKQIKHPVPKGEVDYDTAPLSELKDYLAVDLDLTEAVAKHMKTWVQSTQIKHAYRVEQKVRRLINEQADHGFRFDVEQAEHFVFNAQRDMKVREEVAEMWLPVRPIPESRLHYPPKVQFKQDGKPSANILKYLEKYDMTVDDVELPITEPFVTMERITLKDQTRLKEWLLELGWKPTQWNTNKKGDKTTPMLYDKVTKEVCPNLLRHKIIEEDKIKEIQEWLTLRSRLNVVQSDKGTGWIPKAVAGGGRLRSDADTMGTPTGRFAHRGIVNVPRVTSPYGSIMRSFFIPDIGNVMVGWDASSLESMMEAHYVKPYDPVYAQELCEGDVHTRNQEAIGLDTRDDAKRFKYAVMYGAQPKRLAQLFGVSLHEATVWYDTYWEANEGMRLFKLELTKEWKGYGEKAIRSLDGRYMVTRSEHSLLNTKLQGAGAVLMKHAMIIADKAITTRYPTARGLIRYHDEEQWQCPPSIADDVGKLGVQSIEKAAKYLRLRVPVTGEYKVGESWADTH